MTHGIDPALRLMLLGLFAASVVTPAHAEEPVTLGDAVTKGKLSLNLRYRYEDVDEAGFEHNGRASTLRTALAYRTQWWNRLAAMVEFENVVNIGLSNDHNNAGAGSLWNGVTDLPVIADPPLTEVNQVYLDWKPLVSLPFRGGRQEIIIDNSRFIGNVGWRQNHQTFDGARMHFTGVNNLELGYAYIARQRTVTGASRPMSTSHIEGVYSFAGGTTLRGYLLSIDYDQEALWRLSTVTYGASCSGKPSLSTTLGLNYRIEYATQRDTGDNPDHVDADYLRADLGLVFGRVTAAAGYEVLSGEPGDGSFNTPLATLHKFNGWADKFLVTPQDGLRDFFLSVDADLGAFLLSGVYHDFSADTGGSAWGSEFDVAVVYSAPWKQKFAVKYAAYDAEDWAANTDKIWLWTQWGF